MLVASLQDFEYLILAVLLGTIFGLENEYRMQHGAKIFVGLRTSIFIALLGYIFADLYNIFANVGIIIAGIATMLTIASSTYITKSIVHRSLGATTYVSSIILFTAGMLAGLGYYEYAVVITILITAISFYKREFLNFIHSIKRTELIAAINLMIIALVILPFLPDQDMGPYGFFNPFQFWLIVTLIGIVFFVQYLVLRIRKDSMLLSSIVGSLISGTTITFGLLSLGNKVKKIAKQVVYNSVFSANVMMILVQVLLVIYIATQSAVVVFDIIPVLFVSLSSMFVVYMIGRKNFNTAAGRPKTPFPLVKTLQFAVLFFVIISVGKIIAIVAPGLLTADVVVSALANMIGTMFTVGSLIAHGNISASYSAFLIGVSISAGIMEKGFLGLLSKDRYTRTRIFSYSIVIGVLVLMTAYIQFYGI